VAVGATEFAEVLVRTTHNGFVHFDLDAVFELDGQVEVDPSVEPRTSVHGG
jgi:hypothetical protein